MTKTRNILLGIIILSIMVACVTVNIYFPAAEVQKAADQIVGDVRGEESEGGIKDNTLLKGGEKESWLQRNLPSLRIAPKSVFAEMNIEVTTPAIRSLKESLKKRFSDLKPFYESGRIGENNKGLLDKQDLKGLGLKEKAQLLRLIEEENEDRNALYKEILDANKLGPEHLGEVERIFANSWRKKAPKGWWIQTDKGEWIKKE